MQKSHSFLFFCLIFLINTAHAQEINVLTYNIRYASFNNNPENWNLRRDGVCSVLKGHDFIGLQEVLPVQMQYITQVINAEYGVLFRTRDADSTHGEGSPILYNKSRWMLLSNGFFWLSDTPEIPGSNTWGAAFPRMASFGFFRNINTGDSILVMNTHFDHISQAAREKSIGLILTKYNRQINSIPVVFMGDLNITPDNQVYINILSGSSLVDSYLMIHPDKSETGATFHGWTSETPGNRIDYIFVSPFFAVESSRVEYVKFNDKYPSDHFPVNTILRIKK
jgi:endonuclease/exonuclease/phosphatase family metal-dependent hydrolase